MWDQSPNSQKTLFSVEPGRATDSGPAPGRIATPLGKQHGGLAPRSSSYVPISAHSAAGITWRTLAERPLTPTPESGYDTGAGDVSEEPIRYNYLTEMSIPGPLMGEFDKEINKRAMRYKMLMEQNPHPMHVMIPNPAWQEWMDEHKEQE